jgi:lactoylglutathione lyase
MRYLHTMVRVRDLPAALRFFCEGLGLREIRRRDSEQGRYTLVFIGEHAMSGDDSPQLELTHNWDQTDAYTSGRNFGHVAYEVEDIYAACQRLIDHGYTISRPPRDGRMAFVRSPDLISVELLQKGDALAPSEPWTSMPNVGEW